MQIQVLYTTRGEVLALFQPADGEAGSRFEFRPARGQRCAELEVPAELRGLALDAIHRAAVVKLAKDGPRLVCRKR